MFNIFTKPVLFFTTIASMAPLLAFPSWAFVGPQGWVQEVTADVMPTPDQVRKELAQLSETVRTAESVSVISPTAEREYIEAKNAFRTGDYLAALRHAGTAQRALPKILNPADSNPTAR
ncbi:MAG TPA: hypothetical protein VEF07_00880 [Candidatus Binataceae bacterium]|nr:hypothetical protein [Candidatus Binataceae bacterium]